MSQPDPNLRDIYQARRRIAHVVRKTPLIPSPWLTELSGSTVYLKLENLQQTGSFKIRGAANCLATLTADQKRTGVITVSSGNHGRAVSFVAASMGIEATVCMSGRVPPNKVAAISKLGARTRVVGESYDEAEQFSLALERKEGLTPIPPFDDPDVIAGQGTIGIEILEDLPNVDSVIVPLSGGGLISGIALAVKSADPSIQVIGVSMERAPVMVHSLQAGKPVQMEEQDTLADGLAGGIGLDNQFTFRLVRSLVNETVLVSEEEIAQAMRLMLENHHQVIEGAAAVGIAAILRQEAHAAGKNIVVVISGGNVDTSLLLRIVRQTNNS